MRLLANHSIGSDASMLMDLGRMVVLFSAAVLAGLTLWVIKSYYAAYRRAPSGRHGILPHHVWLIGISYIILAAEAAWQNVERLGHSGTGYIVVNLVAFVCGCYALWLILTFERTVVKVRSTTFQVDSMEITTHDEEEATWDGDDRRSPE